MACFKKIGKNDVWIKVVYDDNDNYIFLKELKNEENPQYWKNFYIEDDNGFFIDNNGNQHPMQYITDIGVKGNGITTLYVLTSEFKEIHVVPQNQHEVNKIIDYLNGHKCSF